MTADSASVEARTTPGPYSRILWTTTVVLLAAVYLLTPVVLITVRFDLLALRRTPPA